MTQPLLINTREELYIFLGFFVALIMLVLKLWKHKSSLPMHLSFAFSSVGQVTGLLIAWPFLATNNVAYNHSNLAKEEFSWNVTCQKNASNAKPEKYVTRIHWAFMINGVLGFLLGLLCLLVVYASKSSIENYSEDSSKKDGLSLKDYCCSFCHSQNTCIQMNVFIMYLVFFILRLAIRAKNASVHLGLMPVALESELHFSTNSGVLLKSLHFLSTAIGRTILGVLSHFISINLYSLMCMTLQLFFMTLIAFNGVSHPVVFWICVPAHGVFTSVAVPATINLFDRYIRMTGFILASSGMSQPIGNAVAIYLNGYLLEQYDAKCILVEAFSWSVVMLSGVVGMILLGKRFGDRFVEEEKQVESLESQEEKLTLMSADEDK